MSIQNAKRKRANRVRLVSVYDAGNNYVGDYSLAHCAEKGYLNESWCDLVRDRKGNVRRCYWRRPVPEPEPWRLLKLSYYAGQRYVLKEQLDGHVVWALKNILGLPEADFMAVILGQMRG